MPIMMVKLENKLDGSLGLKCGSDAYVQLDGRMSVSNNMKAARNLILNTMLGGKPKGYIIYRSGRTNHDIGQVLASGVTNKSESPRPADKFEETLGDTILKQNNVNYH